MASRIGLTTSMNRGSASRIMNAFGGQSVVHVAHGVPCGYASTNNAEATNETVTRTTLAAYRPRSGPAGRRPCG